MSKTEGNIFYRDIQAVLNNSRIYFLLTPCTCRITKSKCLEILTRVSSGELKRDQRPEMERPIIEIIDNNSCLYHNWWLLNFTTWFAIYRPTVAKTAGLPICPWFLTGEMAPFLRQSKESGADLVGIVSEEIVLWSSGILRPMYIFFFCK